MLQHVQIRVHCELKHYYVVGYHLQGATYSLFHLRMTETPETISDEHIKRKLTILLRLQFKNVFHLIHVLYVFKVKVK